MVVLGVGGQVVTSRDEVLVSSTVRIDHHACNVCWFELIIAVAIVQTHHFPIVRAERLLDKLLNTLTGKHTTVLNGCGTLESVVHGV